MALCLLKCYMARPRVINKPTIGKDQHHVLQDKTKLILLPSYVKYDYFYSQKPFTAVFSSMYLKQYEVHLYHDSYGATNT